MWAGLLTVSARRRRRLRNRCERGSPDVVRKRHRALHLAPVAAREPLMVVSQQYEYLIHRYPAIPTHAAQRSATSRGKRGGLAGRSDILPLGSWAQLRAPVRTACRAP